MRRLEVCLSSGISILLSSPHKLDSFFSAEALNYLQKCVGFPVKNPSIRMKSKTQEVWSVNDNQIIKLFFIQNEGAIQQTAC